MARCSLMTAAGGKSLVDCIPPTRHRATNLCFLLKNCSGGGRLFSVVLLYIICDVARHDLGHWNEVSERSIDVCYYVRVVLVMQKNMIACCTECAIIFSPPGRYCVMRFCSCCAVLAPRDRLICISGCSTQWRG
jgi:hypothetical protein